MISSWISQRCSWISLFCLQTFFRWKMPVAIGCRWWGFSWRRLFLVCIAACECRRLRSRNVTGDHCYRDFGPRANSPQRIANEEGCKCPKMPSTSKTRRGVKVSQLWELIPQQISIVRLLSSSLLAVVAVSENFEEVFVLVNAVGDVWCERVDVGLVMWRQISEVKNYKSVLSKLGTEKPSITSNTESFCTQQKKIFDRGTENRFSVGHYHGMENFSVFLHKMTQEAQWIFKTGFCSIETI